MTPDEIKALKVGQIVTVRAKVVVAGTGDRCVTRASISDALVFVDPADIISAEPLPIEVGDTVIVDGSAKLSGEVLAIVGKEAWLRLSQVGWSPIWPLSGLTLIKKASDQ